MIRPIRAVAAGALAATALAAGACAAVSPQEESRPERPPESLCAGFPKGRLRVVCGTVEAFSRADLVLMGWRYVGEPRMQRVDAGGVSFDGLILAPDETVFGVAGHYRFILLAKGGTINWHRVGAPESGPGRELAFEGQTSYGTYRLVLSLRGLPAKGVQIRAHVDATVRPST